MKQRRTGFVALLVLAILAAACGASDVQSRADEPESLQFADQTESTSTVPDSTPEPEPSNEGSFVIDPSELEELDGPHWVTASCNADIFAYQLVPENGGDSRILVTFPTVDCRSRIPGIVSPSGSAMLLPTNELRYDGVESVLLTTAGDAWTHEVSALGLWSPDESAVLAPRETELILGPEDSEPEIYPGDRYFTIDTVTGEATRAIPTGNGASLALWWESPDRVLVAESGPIGIIPFWFDLATSKAEFIEEAADYYRLGTASIDDAASIEGGWRDFAFESSTEICEFIDNFADLNYGNGFNDVGRLPETCRVSVASVVDGNFLVPVSTGDEFGASKEDRLFFVEPGTGNMSEFMASELEESVVMHVDSSDRIVVQRTDMSTHRARIIVVDSSGNELTTLFEGEHPLPRILGLFNQ